MSEMMNYDHGFGAGGMWLLPVLFWILVLIGVFLLLKSLLEIKRNSRDSSAAKNESAITILRKRFAKGEIDEESFKRMKKELEE